MFNYSMEYSYLTNDEHAHNFFDTNSFENTLMKNEILTNKDILHEIIENDDTFEDIKEDDKDFYDVITSSIVAGKDLLISNLSKYKQKKSLQDDYEKKIFDFKLNICRAKDALQNVRKFIGVLDIDLKDEKFKDIKNILESISDDKLLSIETQIEKEINNRVAKIEEEHRQSSRILKYMSEAFSITKNINLPPMCCICLTQPVSVVCNPCGHTFCANCISKTRCYICREKIKDLTNVFFN